jgi:hypothetical protein
MSYLRIFPAIALALCLSTSGSAQTSSTTQQTPKAGEDASINSAPPKGVTVEEIIRRFAAKESEFRQAREQYTYRQDVKVNVMDGGTPIGEFREVVDVTFRDDGRRREDVIFAPQSTLGQAGVSMDPEDYEDIRNRYPFVVTTENLPLYQVLYVGQQRVDEIDTYIFDVAPRKIEKDQRYFQGRVWVDQLDLQIVKTQGRPVFQQKKSLEGHFFPAFTSYREQVDGKHWFPTYARADEQIPTGDNRIRIIVKWQEYKKFGAKSKITYGQEEVKQEPKKPEPPK